MRTAITTRDENIVQTLTLRVRVATLEQIARHWWSDTKRAKQTARERLRKVEDYGLIEHRRVNAFPMLPLDEPVLQWAPGDAEPDLGAVSHQLQNRWKEAMKPMTVYIASSTAANQFGGFGGRFKHRTQLSHDLHLAEVYFMLASKNAAIERLWAGEEVLDVAVGDKRPDAVLLDKKRRPKEVIEFGGRYDKRRCVEFHDFCKQRRLRYRLW